jgi:hypothetical protein
MRYRLTLCAAAIAVAAVLSSSRSALTPVRRRLPIQTRRRRRGRPPAAKPDTIAHVNSCSAYGAGYVNIPGTDTCVKVGGSVTVGGSVGR